MRRSLIGMPGVGKTHLAIGPAWATRACDLRQRHQIFTTTTTDMAANCHRAANEGR
ncbi:ATP-binding protein [Nocardia sp.]|uniref:ATP-binding protein n=1 Tax=Nocardia sp. TaxID=1821 RepID=UPI000D69CF1C